MGLLNELSLNAHSLSVSSWAQACPKIQTNTHSRSTVEKCRCSTVCGENVLTAEIITLTITLSQLQKNKKHLPLLQGHYSLCCWD